MALDVTAVLAPVFWAMAAVLVVSVAAIAAARLGGRGCRS